jgi:hypothetical protein
VSYHIPNRAQSPLKPAPGHSRAIDTSPLAKKDRFAFERLLLDRPEIKKAPQHLLAVILGYCQGRADCFVGNSRLAGKTGYTVRSVQLHLNTLGRLGVIKIAFDRSIKTQRRIIVSSHPNAMAVTLELQASNHVTFARFDAPKRPRKPQVRATRPLHAGAQISVHAGAQKEVGAGVSNFAPETVKPLNPEIEIQERGFTRGEEVSLSGNGQTVLAPLAQEVPAPPPPTREAPRFSTIRPPVKPLSTTGRGRYKPLVDLSAAPKDDPIVQAELRGRQQAHAIASMDDAAIQEMAMGQRPAVQAPAPVEALPAVGLPSPSQAQGYVLDLAAENELIAALGSLKSNSTEQEVALAGFKVARILNDAKSGPFWKLAADKIRRGELSPMVFRGISGPNIANPRAVVVSRIKKHSAPAVT